MGRHKLISRKSFEEIRHFSFKKAVRGRICIESATKIIEAIANKLRRPLVNIGLNVLWHLYLEHQSNVFG